MLTNQSMDQDSPLACLLVGQPTLRRTMKLAALAALEQRTALRYTMPGMTATETSSYIAHHLKLAGRPDQLFTDDALNLIHTTARGYPRAVNNLALQSLVAAFVTGKNLVDDTVPRAAPGCADPPDHGHDGRDTLDTRCRWQLTTPDTDPHTDTALLADPARLRPAQARISSPSTPTPITPTPSSPR